MQGPQDEIARVVTAFALRGDTRPVLLHWRFTLDQTGPLASTLSFYSCHHCTPIHMQHICTRRFFDWGALSKKVSPCHHRMVASSNWRCKKVWNHNSGSWKQTVALLPATRKPWHVVTPCSAMISNWVSLPTFAKYDWLDWFRCWSIIMCCATDCMAVHPCAYVLKVPMMKCTHCSNLATTIPWRSFLFEAGGAFIMRGGKKVQPQPLVFMVGSLHKQIRQSELSSILPWLIWFFAWSFIFKCPGRCLYICTEK